MKMKSYEDAFEELDMDDFFYNVFARLDRNAPTQNEWIRIETYDHATAMEFLRHRNSNYLPCATPKDVGHDKIYFFKPKTGEEYQLQIKLQRGPSIHEDIDKQYQLRTR